MILRNFVVFEGIDGSGTTTQANMLKERMGQSLTLTAEPTKGDVGHLLRRVLSGEVRLDAMTQAYLFAADRSAHLFGEGGIVERAECSVVLSDRYLFSSLVYQGQTRELSETAHLVNSLFPLPELLFYFRISGEDAFRRVVCRGKPREIFENQDMLRFLSSKYDEVIAKYNGTPLGEGMKVITLDATQRREYIAECIYKEVCAL